MSHSYSGVATLPKGFRLGHDGPKTPEPGHSLEEPHPPSPPRQRLRLKKRNAPRLSAPTQHFLASVAAADVPMPSIEDHDFMNSDQEMANGLPEIQFEDFDGADVYHARTFSPPKTPCAEFAPSPAPRKYPNWSIDSSWSHSDLESSPEYDSSRPSTAFSTHTSASLLSGLSQMSEDDDCISPELDGSEFPPSYLEPGSEFNDPSSRAQGARKPRKAPWTKAMSAHLWATYNMYLQDPKVTPVRLGNSGIPPHGVCLRVAREARRTWRGSKNQGVSQSASAARSGSSTPTAENSSKFIAWPHTCAQTRTHLRELCKLKSQAGGAHHRYMSKSPTPFHHAANRRWNRRSTPLRSISAFSAQDMAMSLTLSTSESMNPEGPLAQLTASQSKSHPQEPTPEAVEMVSPLEENEVTNLSRRRLGSPFLAQSYGPSSSSTLLGALGVQRQSHTLGPRRSLKSPVRLTRSRSNTQKRRTDKSLDSQPRKRPSLVPDLWNTPPGQKLASNQQIGVAEPQRQFSSVDSVGHDNPFVPRTTAGDIFTTPPTNPETATSPFVVSATSSLRASLPHPPRLGSPFSGAPSSHSVPNRFSNPVNFNLGAFRKPFATVQQQAAEPGTPPPRSSLASRLAYIDLRLKEFRNRSSSRRRSQSPTQ